ncbi:hypothetical protein OIV83_002469 [Microbotryomycetes sp. JL201]|nr:hypothetical protein OIV83_002469 [Microbotryomycetes sp. JL201]
MSYSSNPYYVPYGQAPAAGPAYPPAAGAAGPVAPTSAGYAAAPYDPYQGGYDADMMAQQSIYTPEAAKMYQQQGGVNHPDGNGKGKARARTTVLRKGGGQVWEDQSLLEWDPSHFRLFIGNLDPALSDEAFKQAFSGVRYPSFVKSKIVRDKYTNKGKGFGFVSYSDPEDFLKVWKEMNGKSRSNALTQNKYVGTRPVKISKATAGVKAVNIGAKKASQLDAKHKPKSGTVPYERSNSMAAVGNSDGSGGFGPERSKKSWIRR